MKDEKNIQEVFDLSDYEKCEELRKSKSRSKKNHSKFTLAHSKQPGNTVCSRPRAAGPPGPRGHRATGSGVRTPPAPQFFLSARLAQRPWVTGLRWILLFNLRILWPFPSL